MKTKRANRLLALLLSLVMAVGLLPMSVLAAGEDATAPARYEYVLASDGIDNGGVYAILTSRSPMNSTGSNRILYYNGTSDRTNQVTPSAISDDRLSLDTSYDTETQLWEASVVEGGIALRSLAGSGNKYLKVASDSAHAHVDVSEDPQALTITNGVSKSGCTGYSIVQGEYSLNWSGSIYTWNDPANVLPYRFFKQTPVWTVTFTGEEVTESTDEVLDGGNATLPAEPSREGYTFEGWFVGEDEFTAETAVTANVTATAKWEEIPVEPEIPDEPEPQEKTRYYFETPGNMPWKIGDGSGGTNTVSDFDDKPDMANVTTIKDAGNYRAWAAGGFLNFDLVNGEILAQQAKTGAASPYFHVKKQESDTYIISYEHTNGITYYLTAENREYNGQMCAVFSEEEADAVPYFIEATAAGAVTYRIYCEGLYTVNFTGEGTEDIASLEGVYYGTTLPTPADREGYTFLGWFDENGNKFVEVTDDVTLTAKWELQKPARAEGERQYELVTANELESGYYVLRSWPKGGQSATVATIRRVANASAVSECKDITIGDGTLNLAGGHDDEHVWLVVKTAEGYVIQSMSEGNGYLNHAASTDSNTNIPVSDTPATFQITYGAKDGQNGADVENAFVISWDNNGTPRYINHSGSVWHGWDAWGIGIAFYKEVSKPATAEPDPGDDDTQTYASPAEAVADGKDVTYFGFNKSARYWVAVSDTTAARCAIHLYQTADNSAETSASLVVDTDGVDNNTGYVLITDPNEASNMGVLHYTSNSNGGVTNQCRNEPNATQLNHAEHLFVFEAVDGGYSIRPSSTTGDASKYLSLEASGSQRAFKSERTVFYVTPAADPNDGTYYIWTATEPQVDVITPPTGQPEGAYTLAPTKFSGTSDKPMDRLHILNQDDDVDTDYRIPALVTLDNGWIVAACDIRWSSTADSPNNLDTIVSVSKDGGESWEWEVVNYFSDFAPINGSTKKGSASFIDPAVVQSEKDGSIYLLVDAQAPYVNGGKIGNGFDDQGRLKISKSPVNGSYSMENAHDNNLHGYTFDYYVDINNAEAGANYTVDGETVKLWPICANADDQATGYYVDAFFNTYYDYGEGGMRAVIAQQNESTAYIHNNIFYTQSEWKVFPTAFLMLRKATVNETTGKLDWGEPMLISSQIKYNNEHFIGVCPGRGFTTTVTENGETVERIIFALYDNSTGTEKASVIYSDDGGVTWHRGERVENGETTSNSESQIVELHDAEGGRFLRMFSRNPNAGQYVSYADSFDNGLTWTTTKYDRELPNGHGTMMSFIGLEGALVSPEGDVYEDVVLASYPRGDGTGAANKRRTNGIVRIGYYDAENETMVWLNDKEAVRYPYKFTYSCLTQLRDGDGFTDGFALLYEDERTWANDHGMEMGFDTFNSADLLGEGWSLVQKVTEDKIFVAPIAEQLYTGEPVEPAVTVKKNGVVMTEGYTVAYSNNTEVGEATVTVTVGEIVVETTFRIAAYVIGGIAEEPYDYTGSAIRPAVTLTKNGESVDPAEYAVSYRDNTEAGTATVIVRVEGNIVASATFQIVKPDDVYTIGAIADRVYTGEAIEPYVTVRKNGTVVTAGFEVEYKNNVNVGTATVTVLVDGVAVAEATFRITPAPADDNTGNGGASNPPVVVVPEDPSEELDDPDVPLTDLPMLFEDVTEDDWYYEAVKYSFDQGMMDGVEETEFAPNAKTNRGMIVTILYRLEQEPETDLASFTDVAAGQWYAAGVAWGQDSGVVEGMDDGTFCPTQDVTREQLAAFLFRYAKYKSYDVSARGDLAVFRDSESTSAWATDFVSWAVGNELIQGKDNDILDPKGTAIRAEVATILMRFCEKFMK